MPPHDPQNLADAGVGAGRGRRKTGAQRPEKRHPEKRHPEALRRWR